MWTHLDAALFVDAGNVASHYGDLESRQRSYGAGLRLHNERPHWRGSMSRDGDQGWHAVVSTSEPLRLPRVRRITGHHSVLPVEARHDPQAVDSHVPSC